MNGSTYISTKIKEIVEASGISSDAVKNAMADMKKRSNSESGMDG